VQVLRPGRIDKHIEVPLPDLKNKLEILLFATDAMPLATDVDLSSLAAHPRLLAASGAELIGVCRDAAFAALREASTGNTMDQATSRQGTAISVAARHFATALAKCPVGPNC
jgi:transitional endoplasmic reticulum ATPase